MFRTGNEEQEGQERLQRSGRVSPGDSRRVGGRETLPTALCMAPAPRIKERPDFLGLGSPSSLLTIDVSRKAGRESGNLLLFYSDPATGLAASVPAEQQVETPQGNPH